MPRYNLPEVEMIIEAETLFHHASILRCHLIIVRFHIIRVLRKGHVPGYQLKVLLKLGEVRLRFNHII